MPDFIHSMHKIAWMKEKKEEIILFLFHGKAWVALSPSPLMVADCWLLVVGCCTNCRPFYCFCLVSRVDSLAVSFLTAASSAPLAELQIVLLPCSKANERREQQTRIQAWMPSLVVSLSSRWCFVRKRKQRLVLWVDTFGHLGFRPFQLADIVVCRSCSRFRADAPY